LIWFFTIFLLFSIATTKNYWYILPVFPAMALIVSSFWLMLLEAVSKIKFGKTLSVVLVAFLTLNIILAFFNVKYSLVIYRNRNLFPVFVNQESIKKELESLDVLLVGANLRTQSNFFYLKRLLGDRFVFSSELYCNLNDKQRMLLKADANLVRKFLESCPQREVSGHYEDYFLIK
jgi:hypothetical protein